MSDPDREVLDEQIAYYRARAPEYDVTSTPDDDRYATHGSRLVDEVRSLAPRGRVLEIAAGTGQWTVVLADFASELVATDTSPEALELNRSKVGERSSVRYRIADVFAMEGHPVYDVVFFGFFLSHVPPGSFDRFWEIVGALLVPGGRVIFVDEGRHFEWREDWVDEDRAIVRRTLTDGSSHRAVKVLWRPQELQTRLRALGWDVSVHETGPFYWGTGTR